MKATALSIAVGMAMALAAPAALAQETTPPAGEGALPPPKVTTKTTVQTETSGGGGAKPAAAADDGVSDHEKVVGHIGVGYLGLTNIPISGAGAGGVPARQNVAAPVIGVRWWLGEKIGLDLGLGLGLTSGSTEVITGNTTTSVDQPGVFAMALHGGVPLVFAHDKHYKFLLVPELNLGFATSTETPTPAPAGTGDITHTGFHLDLGARIGAEIHFGFIGIPQLSLQASVGVFARRDALSLIHI